MLKSKLIRIIGRALICFFVTFLALTYIYTGGFNIFSFSKSVATLFSQSESQTYDVDYVKSNQIISIGEPDGVGVVAYDYTLTLNDVPEKVISVSVDFDKEKASIGDIVLQVTGDEVNKPFTISSTSISNCNVLLFVSTDSIKEVKIISRYDLFGGTVLDGEQIVNITAVKINDPSDMLNLKNKLLIDLIKSIIVSAVICLLVLLFVKSSADKKIFKDNFDIAKVFLFTTLVIGLIFSFLMPVYQVPDEQTHINIMYEELNWDVNIKTQGEISDFADTIRIIRNYDEKVNLKTYFNFSTKSPLPSSFAVPTIKIVKHLPQIIGFVFTTLLRLPLWVCVTFAEICALLIYALFGYFTIKIMPFKKEVMTAIMLLPVCLQEFPSLSYDSFLLSCYFLLFAYIMHVKFTKEKFTLRDLLIILLLTFAIVVTKIPYSLVVGLVFIVPISKIDFNFGFFRLTGDFIKKHKILFLLIVAIGAIAAAIFAIKLIPHIPEGTTFLAAIYDMRACAKLILATIKEYLGDWLVKITGNLGWFDTPVALIFTVFVIANLFFINFFDYNNTLKQPAKNNPFKVIEIVIIFAIAGIMAIITILSMFGWTLTAYGVDTEAISVVETASYMRQIPLIGGIQGRYFVPVIPLLLVPCYFPKISKCISKSNHITYLCGYHIIVFVYLVFVLLNRYWIH